MIELIFALVIMGIVLMSAPMLLNTITQSALVSTQQESIAIAASHMGMVLTHHWDKPNTNPSDTASILTVNNGDSNLSESFIVVGDVSLGTGYRAGTPNTSKRTFISSLHNRPQATPANALRIDSGDRDDIDDFNGDTSLILSGTDNITKGDVIDKNITINTNVIYIPDRPSGSSYLGTSATLGYHDPFNPTSTIGTNQSSNIKMITVRLTSNNADNALDKNITLQAFSCNIGTYKLNKRSF